MFRPATKWIPLLVLIALAVNAAAEVTRQRPTRFDRPTRTAPGSTAQSPTTQPVQYAATFPPALPLARDYAILLDRSIFSKVPKRRGGPVERPGVTVTPAEAEKSRADAQARQQEATLAFRGAMREGSEWIAFIEDTSAGKTLRKHAGDSLGPGVVAQISYESIVYKKGDATQQVEIGQNLRGIAVASSISSGTPTTGPSTQPGESPSPSPASPAPSGESDIERRLRERRQREGG
jgi:hypothetical protein